MIVEMDKIEKIERIEQLFKRRYRIKKLVNLLISIVIVILGVLSVIYIWKFDREGVLIYDSRNQVRVFKVDGEKIVVKRYHRSLFHQRIDYTFRSPSEAKRAYTYALKLLELQINTPEPIACIEGYHWGLYKEGFFVSAFCGDPDARILREEWEEHDDLFNALAHFLVDMHEKGFMHGDTNLSNFLYRKDEKSPTGYCITTIDINRSRFVVDPS